MKGRYESTNTMLDGQLVGKEIVICSSSVLSDNMFCGVFYFPPDVYVGTLKIASIHGSFILTFYTPIRHFSLLNVNVAGACGYDFRCDGGRLVRAYLRR